MLQDQGWQGKGLAFFGNLSSFTTSSKPLYLQNFVPQTIKIPERFSGPASLKLLTPPAQIVQSNLWPRRPSFEGFQKLEEGMSHRGRGMESHSQYDRFHP